MKAVIADAFGQHWITRPDGWEDLSLITLTIPDIEGTFIKLNDFVYNILEVPSEWIHDTKMEEPGRLTIIFDKIALDKRKLTHTIIMCDNNWGPCNIGLHETVEVINDHPYEVTYLKITINLH